MWRAGRRQAGGREEGGEGRGGGILICPLIPRAPGRHSVRSRTQSWCDTPVDWSCGPVNMLVDTAGHYYNYQESAGFSLSPPPSPFPDNYFTFPTSAPEQAQWYHGYSAQSPLLSASASDIPETVRYSGHSGLSHGLGQSQELGNYGVQEAFGHDLGYSQSASLYSSNTNTNYQVALTLTLIDLTPSLLLLQVQQWAESPVELFSPASNDSVYGTNSGTSSDSNSVGEEEEVDVAEEGAASGSQCQWGDCTEEFPDQTQLVTHINSHHVQNRRGSEEYPCYWRVSTAL